jgi:ketosteroid isomerase-like protein
MNQLNPPADQAMSTARAFFGAYSAHDIGTMLRLCADNASIRYVPMAKLGNGPVQTTGRKIWSGLISALPDVTVTIKSSFGDSRHVAAEVLIADYRRGYELMHAFLLTLDESGKITEVAAYWDNANLTVQAGKVGINALFQAIAKLRRRA